MNGTSVSTRDRRDRSSSSVSISSCRNRSNEFLEFDTVVGAVYDRTLCKRNEIRAVIDRAYRALFILLCGRLEEGTDFRRSCTAANGRRAAPSAG